MPQFLCLGMDSSKAWSSNGYSSVGFDVKHRSETWGVEEKRAAALPARAFVVYIRYHHGDSPNPECTLFASSTSYQHPTVEKLLGRPACPFPSSLFRDGCT